MQPARLPPPLPLQAYNWDVAPEAVAEQFYATVRARLHCALARNIGAMPFP